MKIFKKATGMIRRNIIPVVVAIAIAIAIAVIYSMAAKPPMSQEPTQPATVQASTIQPSTTEPPATEPPATEPPATEPPATEPPATEPPATEPPATEPPTTQPPTTEPPTTQPPTVSSSKSEIDEDDEGEIYTLTAYCPCSECSGPWGRKTSSGEWCTAGVTVACNSIDPGTRIFIEGYGEFIVQDTGGGLGPKTIDIFFDTHAETEEFGLRSARVYILG